MALTIAATRTAGYEQPEVLGRFHVIEVDLSITSTYVTNGHAYTQADIGGVAPAAVVKLEFPSIVFRNGTAAYLPYWDKANKKIMFFWLGAGLSGALAEVTNATSLSTTVGKIRVTYYG